MRSTTATRPRAGETRRPFRAMHTAAVALALLSVPGCAPDGTAAAAAAEEFHRSVADSNWSSACSLLQAATREKVAKEQDSTCEDRLRTLQLPEPGSVTRSEAYGRNALVEFEHDTVFLAAGEKGWRIMGAGCTSNGEAPYTCEVGGK